DWARRRKFEPGYVASLASWFKSDPAAPYLRADVDYARELDGIVRVPLKTDLGSLAPDVREVVEELLKLGPIADRIYRRQKAGHLPGELADALAQSSDRRAAAALELVDWHAGPYVKARGNAPIFNVGPYSLSGIGYPPDLTKAELDAYIAAHPDQKARLLTSHTDVERAADGRLVAHEMSEVFGPELENISSILRRAAAKASHPGLKAFLEAKSRDVLTGDYEESSKLWIAMNDSPIDLVIGPTNTSEDLLYRKKGSFAFALYLRDPDAAAIMDLYRRQIPELGRRLPVSREHNPYLRIPGFNPASAMMALKLVAVGGETKVFTPVGWALPIEPEYVAKYGKKMFLVSNVAATRDVAPIDAIHRRLFGREYEPERFFWITTGHEQAHGMLPRTASP